MKVCIDFHYSDFWADPGKQAAPKAWAGMKIDQKSEALYQFTKDSLKKMLDAGVDVGMVQIGNEINNALAGTVADAEVMELLSSGSRAVREIAKKYKRTIQVAIHYTNIEKRNLIYQKAEKLSKAEIDYDIFAVSYYPYWHGTVENMKEVVSYIRETYDKKVIIAETAYCFTEKDGDGFGNSFSGREPLAGYPASEDGQADLIRDLVTAAKDAGVTGVFYWEGAWIPVGQDKETNAALWEKYGSGWATSFAKEYDPADAGVFYGGCSWDNQAVFDFEGHPLKALKVFGSFSADDPKE